MQNTTKLHLEVYVDLSPCTVWCENVIAARACFYSCQWDCKTNAAQLNTESVDAMNSCRMRLLPTNASRKYITINPPVI